MEQTKNLCAQIPITLHSKEDQRYRCNYGTMFGVDHDVG